MCLIMPACPCCCLPLLLPAPAAACPQNSSSWGVRMECLRCMLLMVSGFSRLAAPHIGPALTAAWQVGRPGRAGQGMPSGGAFALGLPCPNCCRKLTADKQDCPPGMGWIPSSHRSAAPLHIYALSVHYLQMYTSSLPLYYKLVIDSDDGADGDVDSGAPLRCLATAAAAAAAAAALVVCSGVVQRRRRCHTLCCAGRCSAALPRLPACLPWLTALPPLYPPCPPYHLHPILPTPAEGDSVDFGSLVSQLMELVLALIGNQRYQAMLRAPQQQQQLLHLTLGYMQMTAGQVERWRGDPNQYVADEEDDFSTVR